MHMLSKKDFSSGELETLKRSRSPVTVVTANGEARTNEEAQVYVHALHVFVTVQLLDHTPAVLSLGKLCKEHGYTYERPSGSEPCLTKNVNRTLCRSQNFVPLVLPGLSSSSTTTSFSTSRRIHLSQYNQQMCEVRWLDYFTENLEIAHIPTSADISHDSDPERFLNDIKEEQYVYSLPERPKLRGLQADPNFKSSLQKANWKFSTSGMVIW